MTTTPPYIVVDTLSLADLPYQRFTLASPKKPTPVSDNLPQCHNWALAFAAADNGFGCMLDYKLAPNYIDGGTGSPSAIGTPTLSHSNSYPGASGSDLVHRSYFDRSRGVTEQPVNHNRDGSTLTNSSVGGVLNGDADGSAFEVEQNNTVVTRSRGDFRRQRIESEKRRREEIRKCFVRLKDTMPVSNRKGGSKTALLERAIDYIRTLQVTREEMRGKLAELEVEIGRLRQPNKTLALQGGQCHSTK